MSSNKHHKNVVIIGGSPDGLSWIGITLYYYKNNKHVKY